jgi:hypothetical protein
MEENRFVVRCLMFMQTRFSDTRLWQPIAGPEVKFGNPFNLLERRDGFGHNGNPTVVFSFWVWTKIRAV